MKKEVHKKQTNLFHFRLLKKCKKKTLFSSGLENTKGPEGSLQKTEFYIQTVESIPPSQSFCCSEVFSDLKTFGKSVFEVMQNYLL